MDRRQISLGLLLLRVGASLSLLWGWGIDVVLRYRVGGIVFPDPLQIGIGPSWALAVIAVVVCPVLVILGVATRLSLLAPMLGQLFWVFSTPATTAWEHREGPALYALIFLVLWHTGPGEYSLDERVLSGRSSLP